MGALRNMASVQPPVLSGALVSWQGLFSEAELDAITRYGDSLALENAELSVGGANYDSIRKTLVAFPANMLHQVTPITRGQRRSLVIWAVGPEFR